MNISLSWLRDYVDWTGSVSELEELLTRTGLSVESIVTRGADFPKVVVAQILESNPHPNADRLSVCRVDDGSGQPRQIVCGAKNYQVGDKVPLALPGAVLPGDFKIKTGKLRGVESEGMMCSGKELGLADDAEGLLILPADAPVGKPLSELFPADTVFELEITPNRPDWLGHAGVAREVAVFSGGKFLPPQSGKIWTGTGADISVESASCPFYSVGKISGLRVGPSPAWLRQRIEAIGLRAINNVVDVTNYVMMELGQPLHAFDAAKVRGSVQVREARDGEKFPALDGREYTLSPGQVVIADDERALALGGVMGGEDSGVTESTTEILLESAMFASGNIRRTSRTLGLASDSSYRFERGVNPVDAVLASQRAAQLIIELAGGTAGEVRIFPGENREFVLDAEASGESRYFWRTIPLQTEEVSGLLGKDISPEEVEEVLNRLGLLKTDAGWQVPSFRQDLIRPVDLIEEVARVIGIDRIPGRLVAEPAAPGEADTAYDFAMVLRQKLAALGFHEARTSTLVSEAMLLGGGAALRLKNPLGGDQSCLRDSLLPSLLSALERNARHGARRVGLFEIGRTFHAEDAEERSSLGLLLSGKTPVSWRNEPERELDWHDLKGVIETLVPARLEWRKAEAQPPFALAADIFSAGARLGILAQLAPSEARARDVSAPVLLAELDLMALRAASAPRPCGEIPKFPGVSRDLAVVAPVGLSYAEIEGVLHEAKEPLLTAVRPFDIFTDPEGKKLPADQKSLAISLTFRAAERTLTSEEVNAACDRLKQRLRGKLAVNFRE